jgi:hypothetical protein
MWVAFCDMTILTNSLYGLSSVAVQDFQIPYPDFGDVSRIVRRHMPILVHIFEKYTSVTCMNDENYVCGMSRVQWWLFLMDVGVRRHRLSLVDLDQVIDRHLVQTEGTIIAQNNIAIGETKSGHHKSPGNCATRLHFFDFICVLIEVAMLIYFPRECKDTTILGSPIAFDSETLYRKDSKLDLQIALEGTSRAAALDELLTAIDKTNEIDVLPSQRPGTAQYLPPIDANDTEKTSAWLEMARKTWVSESRVRFHAYLDLFKRFHVGVWQIFNLRKYWNVSHLILLLQSAGYLGVNDIPLFIQRVATSIPWLISHNSIFLEYPVRFAWWLFNLYFSEVVLTFKLTLPVSTVGIF